MTSILRKKCVICNNKLSFLYKLKDMPISLSPAKEDTTIENDIFEEQIFNCCNNCGCVHLYNLIDPNILYENNHNLTFNSSLWKKHHYDFSNFISNNTKYNSIMEIGGASGALYNHLKHKFKYHCIDLCDIQNKDNDVVFIKGNCETFDFTGMNTIVLSHVFEHLYNPLYFLNNISKYNVNELFISIPNMNQQLSDEYPSILHYEHTYFVDRFFSEYLCSQAGFELVHYSKFQNHSIFMHFVKTTIKPFDTYYRDYISNNMLSIHNKTIKNLKK